MWVEEGLFCGQGGKRINSVGFTRQFRFGAIEGAATNARGKLALTAPLITPFLLGNLRHSLALDKDLQTNNYLVQPWSRVFKLM